MTQPRVKKSCEGPSQSCTIKQKSEKSTMLTEKNLKSIHYWGQRARNSHTSQYFGLRPFSQAGMSNQDYSQQHELEYLVAMTLKCCKQGSSGWSTMCRIQHDLLSSTASCTKLYLKRTLRPCLFMPLCKTWTGGVIWWWHWKVSGAQGLSYSTRQSVAFLACLFFCRYFSAII